MGAPSHGEAATEGVLILDRPEAQGFWSVVWPLAMLAVMAALIVQSCVPQPVAPPKFSAAAAARASNEKAAVALGALAADATLAQVVPLLNVMVINFAPDSAVVPTDGKAVLKAAARVLSASPAAAKLAITGHTDSTGTEAGNLALSLQRAEAVRDTLVALGVAADRISVAGAGDTRPIATNATEQGRFANRRIEFADAQRN